jgi:uncharacterized membrane protein YeiH
MDPIGFILLGTITAIGGGTLRDLILERTVFWTADQSQLLLAVGASLVTYFLVPGRVARRNFMAWSDALGLAAFAVQGTFIALHQGMPFAVAIVLGMMTAVGGGLIRDVLAGDPPMILGGQLYASAAMAGAIVVVVMSRMGAPEHLSASIGFIAALLTRGAALHFNIRMGPPGEFLRIGKAEDPNA